MLDTIYPSKFTDETPMSMHDLRVSPGRTYRYYKEPLFAFGTGLTLTEWRVSGTAPGDGCLPSAAYTDTDPVTAKLQASRSRLAKAISSVPATNASANETDGVASRSR